MSMQVSTPENCMELWCDAWCNTCDKPKKCYFNETMSVNDALTDMLILLPDGKDAIIKEPMSITYLNGQSACLKKFAKRYDYELHSCNEESIRNMEKTLQVKLYFPPHTKKFVYETYEKYYPQLMEELSIVDRRAIQ